MKQYLFFVLFLLLSSSFVYSQNDKRVEVVGTIIVEGNDVEAVTVYNLSSNKGTTTDAKGDFKIKAALNDKIEVSALQFIPFTVVVTKDVIDNKTLKVYLNERINNLDEVVVLPHNLTGDLKTDSQNIKLEEPLVFTFGNIEDVDMSDDYHSKVENVATNQGQLKDMADAAKILKLLVPSLFKRKSKKEKLRATLVEIPISKLSETFTDDYLVNNYNIPKEKTGDFILFLEAEGFKENLLKEENEIHLIEYLNTQSKQFLKREDEKK